jgi:nitrogen regulatory protein PII
MINLQKSEGVSLLNIILPKEMVSKVSDSIMSAGAKGIFQISARGSVLGEGGFFEKIFPPPSPEQVLLQALVSDDEIVKVTDSAIKSGHLDRVGSGAVFSMSCNDAHISSLFPSSIHSETNNSENPPARENLEAICCICEKGIAEEIAKAALECGAPGPTITYGEGGGIRDKIPLLRITKGPEKEFVWCVVDKTDADKVFGNMARAGKITEPGRGFMYSIPVHTGLINVSSTISSSAHGANMEQIISALDDLKGGKEWRTNVDPVESKALKTTYLENLVGLYCVVPRDFYDEVYDSILNSGAPGVSTNFGVMIDSNEHGDSDQKQNEEWALVYTSVGPNNVDTLRSSVEKTISDLGIESYAFYTLPIPKALTYLGG